jgi:hypothetical protein
LKNAKEIKEVKTLSILNEKQVNLFTANLIFSMGIRVNSKKLHDFESTLDLPAFDISEKLDSSYLLITFPEKNLFKIYWFRRRRTKSNSSSAERIFTNQVKTSIS